jgi:hypothetical protein
LDNLAWQRARFVAYCICKPNFRPQDQNLSIYDFLPLPDDPSPEQREKIVEDQKTAEADHVRKTIERLRELGYNV